MKSKTQVGPKTSSPENIEVLERLDKVLTRLDTIIVLLFDLSPDKGFGKNVSMTDKVGYLDSLGYEVGEITSMMNRPSNYTSSRLREFKAKNQKKVKAVGKLKPTKRLIENSTGEKGSNE